MYVCVWGEGCILNEKNVCKEINILGAEKMLVHSFLSTFQNEVDSFFGSRDERC